MNYVSPDATPGRENINRWDGMCELKQGNLNNGKQDRMVKQNRETKGSVREY